MHAESVDSAVKRLTQKPMDIAPAYVPLMNIIAVVQRVHLPKGGELKAYRRMTSVEEIADYEKYKAAFSWKPANDSYVSSISKGVLLTNVGKKIGRSEDELVEEVNKRANVLKWMRAHQIRSYRDVAAIVAEYYARPDEFYQKRVEAFATTQ
jgi:flagellar protein FlaI